MSCSIRRRVRNRVRNRVSGRVGSREELEKSRVKDRIKGQGQYASVLVRGPASEPLPSVALYFPSTSSVMEHDQLR